MDVDSSRCVCRVLSDQMSQIRNLYSENARLYASLAEARRSEAALQSRFNTLDTAFKTQLEAHSAANARLLLRAEDAERRLHELTTAATAPDRPRSRTAKRGATTVLPAHVYLEDAWVDLGDLGAKRVVHPTRDDGALEPLGAADHPPRRASARLAEHGLCSFSSVR